MVFHKTLISCSGSSENGYAVKRVFYKTLIYLKGSSENPRALSKGFSEYVNIVDGFFIKPCLTVFH